MKMEENKKWWGWYRKYCHGTWYCCSCSIFKMFRLHWHEGFIKGENTIQHKRLRSTYIKIFGQIWEFNIPFVKYYIV